MPSIASSCSPPTPSLIEAHLPGAYFSDAWMINATDPSLTALAQFLQAIRKTPRWFNTLMHIRNTAVSLVGLKHLGALDAIPPAKPEASYKIGDRVGIFTLLYLSDNEVHLGETAKHLDVIVAVHKSPIVENSSAQITVTTVVHVHNWLGRLYMLPVTPFHRHIVPVVLSFI